MKQLTTTQDMICSFIAYFKNKSVGLMSFKSIELADLRSKFNKLKIRCHYSGNDVVFTVDGADDDSELIIDSNINILALQRRLQNNPKFLEQDFVLMFCMAILREPERKLTLSRFDIEMARKQGNIDLNVSYYRAEDTFVVKYNRKLILSGAN